MSLAKYACGDLGACPSVDGALRDDLRSSKNAPGAFVADIG